MLKWTPRLPWKHAAFLIFQETEVSLGDISHQLSLQEQLTFYSLIRQMPNKCLRMSLTWHKVIPFQALLTFCNKPCLGRPSFPLTGPKIPSDIKGKSYLNVFHILPLSWGLMASTSSATYLYSVIAHSGILFPLAPVTPALALSFPQLPTSPLYWVSPLHAKLAKYKVICFKNKSEYLFTSLKESLG